MLPYKVFFVLSIFDEFQVKGILLSTNARLSSTRIASNTSASNGHAGVRFRLRNFIGDIDVFSNGICVL